MSALLDRLARYLWPLALANLVANIGIVVTGAAVRLTGSGLGCPTWPRCSDESYVTHGELGVHGVIEFGNRTLTFLLAAIAVLCFLAALGARHRRATRLSFAIGLGIPLQAVIGGITVLTDLNPWIVAGHFLLSMAIISICIALLDELRSPDRGAAPPLPRTLAWATAAAGWVVLYLGTVVTGAGPHAGDTDAPRNGLDPASVSQVHASAVYVLVALTVALLVVALRGGHRWLATVTGMVLLIEVLQGVLGWVQYWLDLPVGLVALHMLGAALLAAGLARIALAVLPHHAVHEARADSGSQPDAATRLP
ncbi:COX15/CtaA family protein [Microbacterium sp. ARD31]|uniref:COX15/CtaA family protein n=1 Tax=Microbacterium sp. ARD31 TaxID=2962576 RepID=UPI00288124ED|nr:COX15/CtaA family protein [Microbacterium sp. ARD31]MDT0187267.1 COX15/CtaA family protein [Microbacterium sp. ARD31]